VDFHFGTLSPSPGLDIDDDGYDDLLVGAAGATAIDAQGYRLNAGTIYVVYGSPARSRCPRQVFRSSPTARFPALAVW